MLTHLIMTSIFQVYLRLSSFIFNIYCLTFISVAPGLHTNGTHFSYFNVLVYI